MQEKDKPNSTTMNGSPGSISGIVPDQMGVKMEPAEAECLSMSGSSSVGTTPGSHNGVKPVSPEQEELIHRLVYYQNEFEQPSDDDIKRITVSPPTVSIKITIFSRNQKSRESFIEFNFFYTCNV